MGSKVKTKISYGESPAGKKFWYVTVAKSTTRKPAKLSVKQPRKKKKAAQAKAAA